MISYILICLSIIFYIYSISKNKVAFFKFILPINVISCVFVYITTINKSKHIKTLKNDNQNKNGKLSNDKINCLSDICSKAATKNECETYTRCKWNDKDNICSKKVIQCDNIHNKNDCKELSEDCEWSHSNGCVWKNNNTKILNQHRKLNKHCFKTKKNPIDDINLLIGADFNEDHDYVKCIESNDVNICANKSRLKLECESSSGYKFNYKQNKCKRIYYDYPEKCSKKVDTITTGHHHIAPKLDYAYKSNLFEAKEENFLIFLKNFLIISLIILVNISTTKLV